MSYKEESANLAYLLVVTSNRIDGLVDLINSISINKMVDGAEKNRDDAIKELVELGGSLKLYLQRSEFFQGK